MLNVDETIKMLFQKCYIITITTETFISVISILKQSILYKKSDKKKEREKEKQKQLTKVVIWFKMRFRERNLYKIIITVFKKNYRIFSFPYFLYLILF